MGLIDGVRSLKIRAFVVESRDYFLEMWTVGFVSRSGAGAMNTATITLGIGCAVQPFDSGRRDDGMLGCRFLAPVSLFFVFTTLMSMGIISQWPERLLGWLPYTLDALVCNADCGNHRDFIYPIMPILVLFLVALLAK
ncbi:hypothetical protein M758_UG071600 [Ceratodon purpureus]|nr:hypothetical protein M758_UG071600 [Ceratodon purpureus]